MVAKDWTKLYKKYKGLWVIMKDDEMTVVGSGKTVKEALLKAKNNGYKNPILNHIPQRLVTFVGAN